MSSSTALPVDPVRSPALAALQKHLRENSPPCRRCEGLRLINTASDAVPRFCLAHRSRATPTLPALPLRRQGRRKRWIKWPYGARPAEPRLGQVAGEDEDEDATDSPTSSPPPSAPPSPAYSPTTPESRENTQ